MKSKAPDSLQTPLVVPEDTSDRYNEIAQGFDSEINFLEITMGIGWLRSWLVRKASGNVLEVSAGTGRNSRYFDVRKCKTITLLDQSQAMIEIARQKFKGTSSSRRGEDSMGAVSSHCFKMLILDTKLAAS